MALGQFKSPVLWLCVVTMFFIFIIYFISLTPGINVTSILATSLQPVAVQSDNRKHPQSNTHGSFHKVDISSFPWQPNQTALSQFLRNLNLTAKEAVSQLAVTLHGPFSLSNDSLCITHDGSPVDMLFLVHTAIPHFDRREKLRNTVMDGKIVRPFQIQMRRVFLVGRGNDSVQQARLEAEHAQNGDLVQADFLDTYHNLSLKGVMGFRWITLHCPAVRLLVKMDDDIFVDTFKLVQLFWVPLTLRSRTLTCRIYRRNSTDILREGKWKVEDHLFRGLRLYPFPYCTGLVVLMTGDVIPDLLRAAAVTPVFWIDDVYLYGMLPVVASNITFYTMDSRTANDNHTQALQCLEKEEEKCSLLASQTPGREVDFDRFWNKTQEIYRTHWNGTSTMHIKDSNETQVVGLHVKLYWPELVERV